MEKSSFLSLSIKSPQSINVLRYGEVLFLSLSIESPVYKAEMFNFEFELWLSSHSWWRSLYRLAQTSKFRSHGYTFRGTGDEPTSTDRTITNVFIVTAPRKLFPWGSTCNRTSPTLEELPWKSYCILSHKWVTTCFHNLTIAKSYKPSYPS